MPLPDVTALEGLLARKKQLASLAVSLDGYDRWGHGSDEDFAAKAHAELQDKPVVIAKLESRIADIKQRAPEVLVAWAQAHLELLSDYLSRVPNDSTEAFVAKRERDQWEKVRDGTLDYVDENPVFVKPDPDVYKRLFGLLPPELHW